MEMRQVALLVIFRHQEEGKLTDLTRLHGQGWFDLEENPPIADIFQYPLTVLRISRFQLLHDEPDGQSKAKSWMTSLVHDNSSHPQNGELALLSSLIENPEGLMAPRQLRAKL